MLHPEFRFSIFNTSVFFCLFACCFFFSDIEILHETFLSIESKDHRLQNVKVILLLPRCSSLGVSNPVEFILNEHEGTCFDF
jgi:hypothetical protein